MKKFIITLVLALALTPAFNCIQAKELTIKELIELSRKKSKAEKRGKTDAKEKKAAGWVAFEGTSPMEMQMANQIAYDEATDDEAMPYFYKGTGTFTSNNKASALKYATKNAIQDIAEQIDIKVASASEMEDETTGAGEYASTVNKNRSTAKDIVSGRLSGIQPIVKIYRKSGNMFEVNVIIFYSRAKAEQLAAEAYGKAFEGNDDLRQRAQEALDNQTK
ncbi:MAG: hypothetical protein HDS04_06815 [Bacteroides sp.]|nr:hypothetical protein [Bacteroides sp.]